MSPARPTPLSLAVGLVVVFLMAAAGLIWMGSQASQASEDRATSRATTQSLCDLLGIYVGEPGQPAPTTARGVTILKKMNDEYKRLHCAAHPSGK